MQSLLQRGRFNCFNAVMHCPIGLNNISNCGFSFAEALEFNHHVPKQTFYVVRHLCLASIGVLYVMWDVVLGRDYGKKVNMENSLIPSLRQPVRVVTTV